MSDSSRAVKITTGDADVEAEREETLPPVLVERLSLVAEAFGQSESQFIKTAIREQLDELLDSERVRQRLKKDFYAGDISYESLVVLLGREEANAYRYLKERLDREPNELPGDPVDEDVYGDFDLDGAPTPTGDDGGASGE
jgi:predicted DNA-binding protein